MINIKYYMQDLLPLLKDAFDTRLLYMGLQGSYLRGESGSWLRHSSFADECLKLDPSG